MSNEYYTESGNPGSHASGTSSSIRSEFVAIGDGFDKLPTLSGNGSKIVSVNAGGTALTVTSTTGSGNVVLATSPTLVTPALGTPSSGTLTNCTGLPATSIASIAAGMATFLTTPSSANLKATVTDETGSGALVFANTPTLVTPVLGAATATSINGLTITSSTGTLTITNAKTLAVSNSVTVTATDGATLAFGAGIAITAGKTLSVSNTLTLAGTDGTSLNINAVTVLNSGTYLPTISGGTIDSSTARTIGWFRIADKVHVFGNCDVDVSALNPYSFNMSLPVATTMTQTYHAGGAGNYMESSNRNGVAIVGNGTTVTFSGIAAGTSNFTLTFSFSYIVM